MEYPTIPHAPAVPVDPTVDRYGRFGPAYEPFEYTDWIDESMSWKETCYIGDWSPLMKFSVKGPDAMAFWESIVVNSLATFDVGQAKHAVLPNESGKVMGEGILMRVAEDELYFTSGPGAVWAGYRFHAGDWNAIYTNLTAARTIQQVQGPASLAVMEEACGESVRDIGFMRFREASIDGTKVLLLRQGMSGDIGYELHGALEEGARVYGRLWEIGQRHGMRRLGARTKMVNHVEACFPTAMADYIPAWFGFAEEAQLRDYVGRAGFMRYDYFRNHSGSHAGGIEELFFSPIELGWGRSVKFDHDYPGRDVLEAELAAPRRLMRTLVWDPEDLGDVFASYFRKDDVPYDFMEWPRGFLGNVVADQVLRDEVGVGLTTSRCYSYFFREMLSLAVLDVASAEPGTQVELLWGSSPRRQKRIRATVAPAPYKTDRRRADVAALT